MRRQRQQRSCDLPVAARALTSHFVSRCRRERGDCLLRVRGYRSPPKRHPAVGNDIGGLKWKYTRKRKNDGGLWRMYKRFTPIQVRLAPLRRGAARRGEKNGNTFFYARSCCGPNDFAHAQFGINSVNDKICGDPCLNSSCSTSTPSLCSLSFSIYFSRSWIQLTGIVASVILYTIIQTFLLPVERNGRRVIHRFLNVGCNISSTHERRDTRRHARRGSILLECETSVSKSWWHALIDLLKRDTRSLWNHVWIAGVRQGDSLVWVRAAAWHTCWLQSFPLRVESLQSPRSLSCSRLERRCSSSSNTRTLQGWSSYPGNTSSCLAPLLPNGGCRPPSAHVPAWLCACGGQNLIQGPVVSYVSCAAVLYLL